MDVLSKIKGELCTAYPDMEWEAAFEQGVLICSPIRYKNFSVQFLKTVLQPYFNNLNFAYRNTTIIENPIPEWGDKAIELATPLLDYPNHENWHYRFELVDGQTYVIALLLDGKYTVLEARFDEESDMLRASGHRDIKVYNNPCLLIHDGKITI